MFEDNYTYLSDKVGLKQERSARPRMLVRERVC